VTYAEFVEAVKDDLTVDADRLGTESLRDRAIKNALINLQQMIPQYRVGHTTRYFEDNLIPYGNAHVGTLPSFGQPSAFYIYSWALASQMSFLTTGTPTNPLGPDFDPNDFDPDDFNTVGDATPSVTSPVEGGDFDGGDFGPSDFLVATGPSPAQIARASYMNRNRLDFRPWTSRQTMIDGREDCRSYLYSISPLNRKFVVYPKVSAAQKTAVLLLWNGIKEVWEPEDVMNMPEAAVQAVSNFVKSKIVRTVDKNIALAREFERDWVSNRLALWREARDGQDAEKPDEEFLGINEVGPPIP